ncbi:MAG: DUF3006 domain-containing protein [Ruminococcus sp.]|nr:DUF3006 domain-containing protein [Ruminococcus sp.]
MIIIDRFEGDKAVLETDGGMMNADRALISADAAEGDVLRLENGVYVVDAAATEARRQELRNRFNRLRRNREND